MTNSSSTYIRHHIVQQPVSAPRVEQRQDMRVLQVCRELDLLEGSLGSEHSRQLRMQHLYRDRRRTGETRAVLRSIRPQMDRYEWFYAPMAGPDFTPTRREHAAIIEAVRHGTPQELERAVRTNWLNATRGLGPLIERFDGQLPAGSPVFSISTAR